MIFDTSLKIHLKERFRGCACACVCARVRVLEANFGSARAVDTPPP